MDYSKKIFLFDYFFLFFISLIVSLLLIKTFNMGDKWLKVFVILAISLSIFIVTFSRNFDEKILFLIFIYFLPLEVNKHIVYDSINRVREFQGVAIWGFDLFFFPILLLWIYQLILNCNSNILYFPHVTIPYSLIFIFSVFSLFNKDVSADTSLQIKLSSLFDLFRCWIIFIYTANVVCKYNKKSIYLIIYILLLTGFFQAFIGIGQYINNGPLGLGIIGEKDALQAGQAGLSRVSGTIGQPNKFALFLGTLLQISIACLFSSYTRRKKYIYYFICFSCLLMLFAIFVSYSRSGWFGFLLGGVVNCSWCMAKHTKKTILSIFMVTLSFIFFAAMVSIFSESVKNRILLDDKGAGEVRKPLAQVAWNIIEDRPILGIGLNNYTACYPKYDNTSYWVSIEFPFPVHNSFLLIAAEIGVIAFFCFLYIMIYFCIALIRITHNDDPFLSYVAIGWFSGVVSWVAHSQKEYEYILLMPRFWFNIGLISAIFHITKETHKRYLHLVHDCKSDNLYA